MTKYSYFSTGDFYRCNFLSTGVPKMQICRFLGLTLLLCYDMLCTHIQFKHTSAGLKQKSLPLLHLQELYHTRITLASTQIITYCIRGVRITTQATLIDHFSQPHGIISNQRKLIQENMTCCNHFTLEDSSIHILMSRLTCYLRIEY